MIPTIPAFNPYDYLHAVSPANPLDATISWLNSFFARVEPYFILLDILFLGIFLYAFYKGNQFRPDLRKKKAPTGKKVLTLQDALFKERWNDVLKRIGTGTQEGLRLAIIEADKLADDALKRMGFAGEHMADRLDKISDDDLRSLDKLWRAHRIRNNVVHTPGFELSPASSRQVIEDYQAFFTEIGLLE